MDDRYVDSLHGRDTMARGYLSEGPHHEGGEGKEHAANSSSTDAGEKGESGEHGQGFWLKYATRSTAQRWRSPHSRSAFSTGPRLFPFSVR